MRITSIEIIANLIAVKKLSTRENFDDRRPLTTD